ncbi:MAG: hypothetical protein ABI425_01545 [Patescibacteria group bacterium]
MKNILKSTVVVTLLAVLMVQTSLAAFTANATVTGNTFSTGTASLKLYQDVTGTNDVGNLSQTLDNTVDFENIYPGWSQDYLAKVYNDGTVPLKLTLNNFPTVANTALRNEIKIEAFLWNDAISNGVVDGGELSASIAGPMTMLAWQGLNPAGINLGTTLGVGATQGVVLKFTTWDLINDADPTDQLQGETMTYDFVFNGTTP